ncbi:peptidase domain-containing ABC transporter [Rheinheimera sp. UJ63]|uniref:peptidase domain-containing ABC transporter n=1 Tax=Rheinheimera sp. UJ63 TaxID=2910157 RepID=UPI001F3C60D9|nr:peptidase domain-containing ABC transporter [Rheinheimera sp. UJ63]MCF4008457.1 peptidase domain-containing ABC transporter [Rheinheimera sp. UJ63]
MIYQSEAAECGLACMAMIANHHGHQLDLTTLRNRYSVSFKGANLQQLMVLANQLGLAGRALKLELEDLAKLKTPCILHWEMNHFVVLRKVHRNGISIFDPAMGERRLSLKEVDKAFTGIALELTPTTEFSQVDERVKLKLTAFWQKAAGLWPSLSRLFILSLLLQLFLLASPYYTQLVVDEVLISHDKPLLIVLALGFGLLVLIQVVTQTLRGWVVLHLGSVLSVQMATNLMRHLLHLPLSYFDKRHMGDVVSRFGSLHAVRELFTNSLVEGVIDGIMALAVLIMMYLYSPKLALVVVIAVMLYAAIRFLLYRPLHQLTETSIMASAKEQTNFMESVRGMQSIKLFGQQSQRLNVWQNRYADAINQNYRLGKWQLGWQSTNHLLFGVENVLVVYLAALTVMSGDMTVGMLFAFIAYKSQFTNRTAALIDKLIEIKMTRLHLDRLADIALTEQEREGLTNPYRTISGNLTLTDLQFRYASNEPWLFNQLNLTVEAGANIAIIGPSGTGKTTLMKLMLGLLTAESGKVLVDGIEITQLGLRHYRSQIAAVMQDDQLLSGSLAENISFFDPELNMQQVHEAAQLAGIHHDISAMPMGYNSLVGDMGSSLSGGQKQRVLLARALYRKPKILFMDEATSHLDVQLEHYVNQAIKQLNMTRIIIAHRPETILNAAQIYLLQNGQLQEITQQYKAQYQLAAEPH